jgi:hypothetical protein
MTAPNRRWLQFSTRDMLLGVSLLATGIGGLTGILTNSNWVMQSVGWFFGVLYGSGALIGAGLFSPFRQKTFGAIVGFLLIYPTVRLIGYLSQ